MRTTHRPRHNAGLIGVLAVIAIVASSCFYTPLASRYMAANPGSVPWWCQGSPDLSPSECFDFSIDLDFALSTPGQFFRLADFTATGATEILDHPADIGVPYGTVTSTFDPRMPNVHLYDGTDPTSRLVGVAWAVSGGEPDGFAGTRDVWTPVGAPAVWWLMAWAVPGYENHPDVFATSHPCLESGITLMSTTDQCFLDSHTVPLEILVTNDDGVAAEGISAIVEALVPLDGVNVTVVAPGLNQSGSGGAISGVPLFSEATTTHDGYPARGVYTTLPAGGDPGVSAKPADSVIHAIDDLGLAPDLVVSGINEGQNISSLLVPVSGTVGAARRGALYGIDAIATSQGGIGVTPDFPTGVAATLELVEDLRLGEVGFPNQWVLSINIPSCAAGSSVRGTVFTAVGDPNGRSLLTQDCTSTVPIGSIVDDVDAFNNGFTSVVDVAFAD